MNKYYTIDGKYWELIDKIVADYMATEEYQKAKAKNADELDKRHAASWLTDRLDKSAQLDSIAAKCFTITESEWYGLIKIVELNDREDTKELLDYLKNHKGDKNEQINK